MIPKRLQVPLIVAGALLLAASADGPDFGHYIDWAAAALERDIFQLRSDILSPAGLPYNLWSFEPGLLFAITNTIARDARPEIAAYVTGWLAAMVFWGSAVAVLWRVTGRNTGVALLALAALFVGTHAGVYSHAYATEVFGMALVGAVWALGFTRAPWARLDALAAGSLIALLFLVRPYLVVYAVAPLWLGIRDDRFRVDRLALIAFPILIALAQYLIVNAWMTGSPWHAPYVFGGSGFHSIDLAHPEAMAVLTSSFHGLLAYHPLYGVAFAALLVRLWSDVDERGLWGTTLFAVLVHLWLQTAWYTWWLGMTTFGMRGMAPAALPLMAALAVTLRRDSRWLPAVVACCLWSFALMLRGPTHYATWQQLLFAQRWVMAPMLVAAIGFWFVRRPAYGAAAIALLATWYLGVQLVTPQNPLDAPAAVAVAAAGLFAVSLAIRRLPVIPALAPMLIFVLQAALFVPLAVATMRHLSASAEPPRPFRYRSAAPIDELLASYREYQTISGFDDKKTQLRRFLDRQIAKAPILSPADRVIVTDIRTAFAADPRLSGVLLDVTSISGVVRLASYDTDAEQRALAIELATAVPGVVSVENQMH